MFRLWRKMITTGRNLIGWGGRSWRLLWGTSTFRLRLQRLGLLLMFRAVLTQRVFASFTILFRWESWFWAFWLIDLCKVLNCSCSGGFVVIHDVVGNCGWCTCQGFKLRSWFSHKPWYCRKLCTNVVTMAVAETPKTFFCCGRNYGSVLFFKPWQWQP